MKVLILGGTNFIGVEIVSLLLDKGLEVTCYTRGNKKINRNASHIKGDRDNKSLLKKVASNEYDIVIDNISFSGEDVSSVLDAFKGKVDTIVQASSMSEAVNQSYSLANKGEVVLLSPACASFDLFENYEDRGFQFKKAVRSL